MMSVFDHFVKLALKGLSQERWQRIGHCKNFRKKSVGEGQKILISEGGGHFFYMGIRERFGKMKKMHNHSINNNYN